MLDAPYWTVTDRALGVFKDRGSAFHALAAPLHSAGDFAELLAEWVAEHRGARHHAWAYRLREPHDLVERSHDAGEPSHSAGTPILHSLQSAELLHTAVVVTRYFGGVKLGVGGLITAYRSAAELAIEGSTRLLVHPEREALLVLPYSLLGRMEADSQSEDLRWIDKTFDEVVTLRVRVRATSANRWAAYWDKCYPLTWSWVL